MIWRKGIDLLLTAFDRLVAKGADVRLLLVGREAELPKYLATLRPASRARIRYEGFQPPESLPATLLHRATCSSCRAVTTAGALSSIKPWAPITCDSSDAAGAGFDLVEEEINGLASPPAKSGVAELHERFVAMRRARGEMGQSLPSQGSHEITPKTGAEEWIRVFRGTKSPASFISAS